MRGKETITFKKNNNNNLMKPSLSKNKQVVVINKIIK